MTQIHELLARPGGAAALQLLVQTSQSSFDRAELEDMFAKSGVAEPAVTIEDFLASQLLERYGGRFGLSTIGARSALLVEAINGGDIEDIYRQLRRLNGGGEPYELIREGMTGAFLESLVTHPGFGRLYVCSPWINPSKKEAAYLKYGCILAERSRKLPPEVFVISRPERAAPGGTEQGLQCFREVGAKLYFHARVHTKLYIREPDASGGYALSIVGSQNLTRSNHFELGIKINGDMQLINQLVRYFLQLMSWATEDGEGDG